MTTAQMEELELKMDGPSQALGCAGAEDTVANHIGEGQPPASPCSLWDEAPEWVAKLRWVAENTVWDGFPEEHEAWAAADFLERLIAARGKEGEDAAVGGSALSGGLILRRTGGNCNPRPQPEDSSTPTQGSPSYPHIERVGRAIFASGFHEDDQRDAALIEAKWNEWPEDRARALRAAMAAINALLEGAP